jgi:hypothetical protein
VVPIVESPSIFAPSVRGNRSEVVLQSAPKSVPKQIRLLICPIASIIGMIGIISNQPGEGVPVASLRLFLLGSPRVERDGVPLEFDTSLEVSG